MTQNIVLKEISYLRILKILIGKWHWIISGLIVSLSIAFGYLSFTTPVYRCNASLKFEEKRSELSELTSIRNIYERTNKVESEALIIKSRTVLTKAIRSLNYNVSFYKKSNFKLTETYPAKPLTIKIIRRNQRAPVTIFAFQAISHNRFKLSYKDARNNQLDYYYKYGDLIKHPSVSFKILASNNGLLHKEAISFHFNNDTELMERITRSLRIDDHQNINVLNLGITDHNPHFATDILNAIMEQYLIFDKYQRLSSASQTEKFINTLLRTISVTADSSAKAFQKFREEKDFAGQNEAHEYIEKLSSLQNEAHVLSIKILESSFIKKRMDSSGNEDFFNYNLLSVTDTQLIYLITKYNEVLAKKRESEHLFPKQSVFLAQIEQQIDELKTAISKNITSQHEVLIRKDELLKSKTKQLQFKLKAFPSRERQFAALQSRAEIQQKVLNYLIEKKLEAQVSKSAVTPGAMIIDLATTPAEPIAPIPRNTYTTSILCSLLLSAGAILIAKKLNPHIHTREEIEDATDIPILGVVPKHKHTDPLCIPSLHIPECLFSESIRALRSNLSFLATEKPGRIIHITSEISGEGKSFLSVNLATSLSLINKKVILIAADLRKSSLHKILNLTNQPGLSNYLVTETEVSHMIKSTNIPNLDFISSGTIPPNPAELLHSKKMEKMLLTLRKSYDFIVIDSAPVGIVSDCKPIIKIADINLFIIRAGISRHNYVFTPQTLKKEFNLSNVSIILNDFQPDNFHIPYYNSKRSGINYQNYSYRA
ncbi:polysaccharide biosynthesis tyrosine autokinase [Pedobacter frigoris]|uniref:GumC family protein n=1 Tax=Pedobacter frigoris TaxID=2571272 RepID=UPI00292F8EF1|nr:polysaccharide biosynthesis tyrosine autokinase [Pedobacter frigoris]